ncbi:CDP-diacylglycerol--inositol 3-phosphatidyltransferase-like [Mya arenaria]|uniref:CDP-diacylglycerol--inositol 3-phosphatidyltransferase-like n=1 Tax=Mya arenaria TaxID=6604 RepID=UPI0022E07EA2|nr:CDP-diacylglycerol--inositol 3-phosphatidyltransferase-like [Mya arenaria]
MAYQRNFCETTTVTKRTDHRFPRLLGTFNGQSGTIITQETNNATLPKTDADSQKKKRNVFLFVPNLIDYMRVVFLVMFCYEASYANYYAAVCCYVVNFALDEIDGNMARWLGQTSEFGMLLDILTDEASVTCVCMVLATLYPAWLLAFQAHCVIDFMGQWTLYYYAGRYKNNDFKTKDNWILDIYFNSYVPSFLWVYGNHVFLISLYLCNYASGPLVGAFGLEIGLWKLLACVSAPLSISRLAIMLNLLLTQMYNVGQMDMQRYSQAPDLTNGNAKQG